MRCVRTGIGEISDFFDSAQGKARLKWVGQCGSQVERPAVAPGYSDLKVLTGLARAALRAWIDTVSKAMRMAPRPAAAKIHQ